MPHLIVEYTSNLDFAVQPLLEQLNTTLAASGAIALKGLKSRAVRRSDFRIADGNPAYAFVHVSLLIRAGRSVEVQQDLANRVLTVLKDQFGARFAEGYLSLSVDIKEMAEGIALTLHNIPALG